MIRSGSDISISNCIFYYNAAKYVGGALYVHTGCTDITIDNCYFEYNYNTCD